MTNPPGKGYLYEVTGERISLYVEHDVLTRLDAYAEGQQRSRSWMANRILRNGLGIADDVLLNEADARKAGGHEQGSVAGIVAVEKNQGAASGAHAGDAADSG